MRDTEIQIKINAYVNGRLSEEEIEALWFEVAKNPDLLMDLEIEAGVKHILDQKKARQIQNTSGRIPRWSWHAAAAAVLAVVALIQIFRADTPTELNTLVLGEIDISQFETSDHVRGEEVGVSPTDSLLDSAFAAFYSGNAGASLQILDSITDQYEGDLIVSKVMLNRGIIFFNEGMLEQSVIALQKSAALSAEGSLTKEKAHWFLANALVKTDRLEEARQAVVATYQLNGIFKEDAYLLLLKLNGELEE